MNLYVLSGLGADRSVFENLRFPAGLSVRYLDWVSPNRKESLKSYALRMAEGIDRDVPFALLGLSFGGMLAAEIAQAYSPAKTILISSAPVYADLPLLYRIAGKLGLQKLMPAIRPSSSFVFFSPYFGMESQRDRQVFRSLLEKSDPVFTRWAVGAILGWRGRSVPADLVRIHGTHDRVLPLGNKEVKYRIEGGGHFMVFNRAEEVSKILAAEIDLSK